MNRAVVIRAAAGLTAYLQAGGTHAAPRRRDPAPTVVVGFDARHNSDVFARDTAAVVTAAGGRALLLPRPLPTPLLAFAIRHLGADAGVMVTASHNPAARQRLQGLPRRREPDRAARRRRDRGLHRRRRLVASVARARRRLDRPRRGGRRGLPRRRRLRRRPRDPPRARRSSTPRCTASAARSSCARSSGPASRAPVVVEEQAAPDPDFPTVPFPNPEEPGAMDLALARRPARPPRRRHRQRPRRRPVRRAPCRTRRPPPPADPDGWRMLRGDEVGVLLGAHVLAARGRPGRPARRPRALDRLVAPARRDGRGGRRARRRDAHRLQVDRPGAAPALRLRGGDRVLRRPRPTSPTRTGSRRRCSSPTWSPACGRRAARCSTSSTTWPGPTASTPPTRSRCGSPTCRSSTS